jgi:hypothetical protein
VIGGGALPARRRRGLAVASLLLPGVSWVVTRGVGLPFPPWPPGGVFGTWHPLVFGFNLGLTYLALLTAGVLWGGDTRQRFGNALLGVIAPGICLLLVELPALLGIIDYRDSLNSELDRTPWEGEHNRLDDELIHIHPPYDRITGRMPGDLTAFGVEPVRLYEVDYQYDSNGFRNHAEYDSAAVVLSGDSFVEALLTPVERSVSVRLEERLRRPVYNLGQSNWGPSHQVPALRRFGLPLEPQTVVWFFFEGNDLKDVGVYAGTIGNLEERSRRYDRFTRRSFVRNVLWLVALMTNRDDRMERRRSCELTRPPSEGPGRLYFLYAGEPLTAHDDSLLQAAQREILVARAETEAAGAVFVLAFVPTKFRVYADLCEWTEQSDLAGWVRNDLPARMAAFAERQDMLFLDLTEPLRAASEAGALTYFEDDTHWTPAGHDVVADAVARLLSGRATPPAGPDGR